MQRSKPITIYDIARESNVSPATVSRVLNGSANVAKDKANRVLETVEKLGFRPNALAKGLSSKQSGTIGFIMPDIKSPYFSTTFYEVEQLASTAGYTVLLGNSQSDLHKESQLLKIFVQQQVEGIIFMGGRIDSKNCNRIYLQELEDINKNIPIVIISMPNDSSLFQINIPEDGVMMDLIAHLKSCGAKSAGMIGGCDNISVSFNRRKCFRTACEAHNIEVRPEWIIDGGFSIESGIISCQNIYECVRIPNALCCINDMVAVGVLQYLERHNINVPQDIMLTGFDGCFLSEAVHPPITTVGTNYKDFAKHIFETLLSKMQKEDLAIMNDLNLRVIVRGSTRKY